MKIITGIRAKNRLVLFYYVCCFLLLISFLFSAGAFAISRGFQAQDNSIKPGMLVMLSPNSSAEFQQIERATTENLKSIIGVATTVEDSSVTVASSGQSVFVENEGEVQAYVSDLHGEINQGDELTVSPLKGILSLANSDSKIILGTALEDFPSANLQSYEIDKVDGEGATNIALMRINLSTKLINSSAETSSSLEELGQSITGREVSGLRVAAALVIFLLVLFAEGGILYGSTSSAITSIGRNPLAGRVIRRQLLQITLAAFGVLAIGLISIYLILWA